MIHGTALTTYEAVLAWLGTGHITLAPLLSSCRTLVFGLDQDKTTRTARARMVNELRAKDPLLPPPASPKSVYRLAHLLSLTELSTLALANFIAQLTPDGVAWELFSDVAGVYPELRSAALKYAVQDWSVVKTSRGWTEAAEKAKAGTLEHPVGMLMELASLLK